MLTILNFVLDAFSLDTNYTEKEVNRILRRFHADTATLNLSATLVHSENEIIVDGVNTKKPANFYEFIEIAIKSDKFSKLEAKLSGEVLERPVIG